MRRSRPVVRPSSPSAPAWPWSATACRRVRRPRWRASRWAISPRVPTGSQSACAACNAYRFRLERRAEAQLARLWLLDLRSTGHPTPLQLDRDAGAGAARLPELGAVDRSHWLYAADRPGQEDLVCRYQALDRQLGLM